MMNIAAPHTVNEDLLEVVQARAIIHKWTINKSDYVSVGATKSLNEIYSRQLKCEQFINVKTNKEVIN